MTLKEYLSRATKLKKAVDATELQLKEWKAFGMKSRSFLLANGGSSSRQISIVERTIIKIARAEEQMRRDIEKYVDLQKEVREFIYRLEDLEERMVLERHYLMGQKWEEVAEACFISIRSVHYIKNTALEKLTPYYLANIKSKEVLRKAG